MECPFCGEQARLIQCNDSKDPHSWYFSCPCEARGFIPHAHVERLQQKKKIVVVTS